MKKKILKIINNWLKEREIVDEPDYDVRMCNAEDALFKIFERINKPKNKKQMYCNFVLREHYAYDGEKYYTWDLISITATTSYITVNDNAYADPEEYDYCSVPMENYLKEVK